MANTLHLLARMTAKGGQTDALKAELQKLIEPTHAEPGCIRYEMWQNRENPAEFTFVEEWADDAALDAHFQTPHMQEIVPKVQALIEGELDLRKFDRRGG